MANKTHLELVRETWGDVATYVRQVWGPEAVYDLVGRMCLIHLDRPAEEARQRRIAEAQTRHATLAEADCPLCREMAESGGDEIFDGTEEQPSTQTPSVQAATV